MTGYSYNRFPDEKGTESLFLRRSALPCACYNRFPDEKGTESVQLESKLLFLGFSYNRFPDEKGTERLIVDLLPIHILSKLQPLPR